VNARAGGPGKRRDPRPPEAPQSAPAAADAAPEAGAPQPRNPLHGVTLERVVSDLAADLGWAALARRIPIRCFTHEPSVASSLRFLRRTPWARARVEALYLETARARERRAR
jgi:uncharacterized protein (DUF2132 family)